MEQYFQQTIGEKVSYEGVGLFFGQPVRLTLHPAEPNSGIVFILDHLPNRPRIPLTLENIELRPRRTCLVKDGAVVETIEHFLAALAGLSIDNLEVEINGSEMPVADGSAAPFVELIKQGGVVTQGVPKKVYRLLKPVSFSQAGSSLVAIPSDEEGLTITYTIDYSVPLIGTQHFSVKINSDIFIREIAPSRTFILASEVGGFLAQGLGKGGSYQNTLVVDYDRVIDNELRFPNEFVRHKILDLLGDLYLLNTFVLGEIVAVKTGHQQNLKFIQKLAEVIQGESLPREQRETWIDVRQIQNILPHRYPFLLIDRIIHMDGYRRAVGIKNVTINEPFFQGHFPGQPVMPAVLQIEAMAQLAGALLLRRAGNENKLGVLLGMDKVKFRKSVMPGDQLRIEAETIRLKSRTGEVYARAFVQGELVSEATIKFMLVDME